MAGWVPQVSPFSRPGIPPPLGVRHFSRFFEQWLLSRFRVFHNQLDGVRRNRPTFKRIEKLRYMQRNPVKRGLIASLEFWRWSSFGAYFLGEAGPFKSQRVGCA
jgi:hypothetical protein